VVRPPTPARTADLGITLTLAMRGFVDLLHRGMDERGFGDVRPAYGVVFRALRDGGLTLTALAEQLGVTKQSAAKVVADMQVVGLVAKRPSDTDGRAVVLELTDRGRAAMVTAIAIGGQLQDALAAEVGEDAVDDLHRTLGAFIATAGGADDLTRRRSRAVWF